MSTITASLFTGRFPGRVVVFPLLLLTMLLAAPAAAQENEDFLLQDLAGQSLAVEPDRNVAGYREGYSQLAYFLCHPAGWRAATHGNQSRFRLYRCPDYRLLSARLRLS